MEALDIVGQLIAAAQAAMALIAEISLQFGATIAVIALLFGMAVRVAGGGEGATAGVVSWIIHAGLVLGAIQFWPEIMDASFQVADQIAMTIGGAGIGALDVLQRGFDVFSAVVSNGISGSIWNPGNYAMYALIVFLALVLLAIHALLSLIVAASILQFWIGGAVMVLVIPFALVVGLQGVGFQALAFVIAAVVRMIVIAVIVAIGGDVFLDIVIPDEGSVLTLTDLGAAFLATFIVTGIALMASTWASVIARAAPGSTGITGMLGTVGAAAVGGMGAAAARAGSAGGGAAAGGGGAGGAAAFGGGGAAGGAAAAAARSAGRQQSTIGRQATP